MKPPEGHETTEACAKTERDWVAHLERGDLPPGNLVEELLREAPETLVRQVAGRIAGALAVGTRDGWQGVWGHALVVARGQADDGEPIK